VRTCRTPTPTRFLILYHAGVSTSSDVEQYAEIGGKRYSDIIDPRTGEAMIGRSSVTVVAASATASDSLATAISVLGPKRGLELAKATSRIGLYFVQSAEHGTHTVEWTPHPAIITETRRSADRVGAASVAYPH
jgi:thiamine biosynthesis lipoprotein